MARLQDVAAPVALALRLGWDQAIDTQVRAHASSGFWLDTFPGADDDAKLTAAIAAQQGATALGMPPIILAHRDHSFNQTRSLYSGLKLIGAAVSGQKNPEISGTALTGPTITLGAAISSGTSSWWVGTGTVYDVYMADFCVVGDQGTSKHQFLDHNSGTLYACEFRSLSFNFMRSVFGRYDRVCLFTQVMLTGNWTMNNAWEMQVHIGGSDCVLWMDGIANIGTGQSAAQSGSYTNAFYYVYLEGVSNTNVGAIYISCLNGWRGLRVGGSSGNGINFHGGVYEGYKGTGTATSGLPLRASGSVVRLDSGSGNFYGGNFGQAMASPNAAEHAYIEVAGGEWGFHGPTFYHGDTADTVPVIYQSGGKVYICDAHTRQSETWAALPHVTTGAPAPTTLASSATAGATSVSVTAAVVNGAVFYIGDARTGEARTATSVTGSGPYTVGFTGGLANNYASGTPVLPNVNYTYNCPDLSVVP